MLCLCCDECSDDRQMEAAGCFLRPLFHPFVRSTSSFPARNKLCHWPLSSTDAPLRSQTHTHCQPTRSNHAVLAPYQRKIHSCWVEPVNLRSTRVIQTVKVSLGVETESILTQTWRTDKPNTNRDFDKMCGRCNEGLYLSDLELDQVCSFWFVYSLWKKSVSAH